MKVTRYFQSCLLIEEGNTRILIDPSGHEKDNIAKLGRLDAVLYTHEHLDHFDADMAKNFVEQGIASVYANASTSKLIMASKTEVKNGQEFEISGIKIKAIELPHCLMFDGSPGPQNTGYLINDQLFDPGDGKELAGLEVDNLVLPIVGPDVSFMDAFNFAKQVSAKTVIPVHYDFLGANANVFASIASGSAGAEPTKFGFKVIVLGNGQSTDL
jgi:L-ascorbate metabolism protein UlaG (beta-lactamase superfamily)